MCETNQQQTLENLRRSINTATEQLVTSHLLSEQATRTLYTIVDAQVAKTYTNLIVSYDDDSNNSGTDVSFALSNPTEQHHHGNGEDTCTPENVAADSRISIAEAKPEEDPIDIFPVRVQGTPCQARNDLVFPLPFYIVPFQTELGGTSHIDVQERLACLAVVALFNLGLARQNQAYDNVSIIDATERMALLEEALFFYQQAHELLDKLPKSLPTNGMLIFLYLAICNNLVEVLRALPMTSASIRLSQFVYWHGTLQSALLFVPLVPQSFVCRHFLNVGQVYHSLQLTRA